MNTSEKNLLIEKLEKTKFEELIESLVLKLGYFDVIIKDFFIIAKWQAPLSVEQHAFLLFEDQLSGVIDIKPILRRIENSKGDNVYATTFIVSKFHISKGFEENLTSKLPNFILNFLGRDRIVETIEKVNSDFWKHDDFSLLDYEKNFCSMIVQESELKSLKIFSEKYSKLLDIFIDPRIVHYFEDKDTKTPTRKNISLENILSSKKPIIIAGEAGTGKSTLLKKIGEEIIRKNVGAEKKNLPLFITVTELFESKYDVAVLINNKLSFFFDDDIDDIFKNYYITLLIDSMDELEIEHQRSISKQLDEYYKASGIRYILATRSTEKSVSIDTLKNLESYNIVRFSNQQIEQFVSRFFINQKSKAERLIEALRENRIIEKLPITPLSLSLISILFEENDLEIPATITDIYENFNSLLLGKAIVSNRVEFIDISFKERLLSLYALALLNRKEHNPMTKEEFFSYFSKYFESKTIPLRKGTLEDVLNYLIENTGVIYIKNATYVAFNHDSFMEYYAAVEIFKHQREHAVNYVDNFFDINWQNSAIFYAGHSKDMPTFLESINEKLYSANNLGDYFSGINGAGYILQALFQTDNQLRKKTVEIALEVNIRALEMFIKLSSDERLLFKAFKLPIIWLVNLMYFYENFNSGTLREPLKLAYESIITGYLKENRTTEGYKALIVALTLNSNRINERVELEDLFFKSPILDDNILTIISEISLNLITNGSLEEIKKVVKKEFKKVSLPMKHLLETPANRLRFSDYDSIKATKRIKIITEGKTDAVIFEHAFMTLSGGKSPYWQIKPAGNQSGGAHEVFKALISCNGTLSEDEIVIGIFDHDEEGLANYRRFPKESFEEIKVNLRKKSRHGNAFALLLPIPGDNVKYLMSEQKFNYFELEHYFPIDFLTTNDALKQTPLSNEYGIYSIKDNKKDTIEKKVCEISDPNFFKDFLPLFEEIDDISSENIVYVI